MHILSELSKQELNSKKLLRTYEPKLELLWRRSQTSPKSTLPRNWNCPEFEEDTRVHRVHRLDVILTTQTMPAMPCN